MVVYAAFVHYLGWSGPGTIGFTRGRYLGHHLAIDAEDGRRVAREQHRVFVRSCDRVSVRRDSGRRKKYGIRGAGSPGGVGLL